MTNEGTFFKILGNLVTAKAGVHVFVGDSNISGVITCICDDCIIVNGDMVISETAEAMVTLEKKDHVIPLDAIIDIGIDSGSVHLSG